MSLDDDEEDGDESIENEPNLAQQLALARCDLSVLLIKIQMDLFAPNLRRYYFLCSTPFFLYGVRAFGGQSTPRSQY